MDLRAQPIKAQRRQIIKHVAMDGHEMRSIERLGVELFIRRRKGSDLHKLVQPAVADEVI